MIFSGAVDFEVHALSSSDDEGGDEAEKFVQ